MDNKDNTEVNSFDPKTREDTISMNGPDNVEMERVAHWYFGGLAAAGAVMFTHPLDLLKVHIQTQQESKESVMTLTTKVLRREGVLGLYNGISAAVARQLTYSTVRFGIYEKGKQIVAASRDDGKATFGQTCLLAALGGGIGGYIGVPTDLVNVRMQNDVKLAPEQRRDYKNVFDGLYRVYKEEGFSRLFAGGATASMRTTMMALGQLVSYDYIKAYILRSPRFKDDLTTHCLASLGCGVIATTITQPLDVLKTRLMNAKPGEFKNLWAAILYTAKLGPTGFFKGYFLAFSRLAPQTILMFVFLEQLRLNFGFVREKKP